MSYTMSLWLVFLSKFSVKDAFFIISLRRALLFASLTNTSVIKPNIIIVTGHSEPIPSPLSNPKIRSILSSPSE